MRRAIANPVPAALAVAAPALDEVDVLLGDTVTEGLAKIVTGAFDDNIDRPDCR